MHFERQQVGALTADCSAIEFDAALDFQRFRIEIRFLDFIILLGQQLVRGAVLLVIGIDFRCIDPIADFRHLQRVEIGRGVQRNFLRQRNGRNELQLRHLFGHLHLHNRLDDVQTQQRLHHRTAVLDGRGGIGDTDGEQHVVGRSHAFGRNQGFGMYPHGNIDGLDRTCKLRILRNVVELCFQQFIVGVVQFVVFGEQRFVHHDIQFQFFRQTGSSRNIDDGFVVVIDGYGIDRVQPVLFENRVGQNIYVRILHVAAGERQRQGRERQYLKKLFHSEFSIFKFNMCPAAAINSRAPAPAAC